MKAACKTAVPTLEIVAEQKLPRSTNCLTSSEDGKYLALGHVRGLSVWDAATLTSIATWDRSNPEITLIRMTKLAESAYLIGTVDNMGIGRMFAHDTENIFALCELNPMDDINKRSNCTSFDLSEGGEYGVAEISCAGDVFVEFYQFPVEAWLEELETIKEDLKPEEDLDVTWTPLSLQIKITQPKIPGKITDGSYTFLPAKDFSSHWLALDGFKIKPDIAKDRSLIGLSSALDDFDFQRRCTHNFLMPWNLYPEKTGTPFGVMVWWTGSKNLYQYFFQSLSKNKNPTPTPDVIFPNAKEIVCSTTSRCTRYIALGLDDALVCVWDRHSGSQLSVSSIPTESNGLFRMQFVDHWDDETDESFALGMELLYLFVLCKSGATHIVSTGYRTTSCVSQLTDSPKTHGYLPTFNLSLPFLDGVSLVVQANGRLFLQDIINQCVVCVLSPPEDFQIACPNNPVFTIDTEKQILFIQGYHDIRKSHHDSSQTLLFVFNLRHSENIKNYMIPHPDALKKIYTHSDFYRGRSFDVCLQHRLSVAEREKSIKQSWERLLDTAKARHQGGDVSSRRSAQTESSKHHETSL